MCTAFLRFTRPWCNGSFSFSQVTHIWWCLSFGCRQFNLACFGSLGCHGPTPDTQNNTRAFLALSSTISFILTRLVLFLSLWRLDSILYYLLFLLSFPCRPLSDTSSLSVLLRCVLVEEDLWACSRHSSPHKKIKNIERAPPPNPTPDARLALCSENMEHGCLLFHLLPRSLAHLWVSSPFFNLLLLSFSPSVLAVIMFLWRQCCKGAWQVKPTSSTLPPPPNPGLSL